MRDDLVSEADGSALLFLNDGETTAGRAALPNPVAVQNTWNETFPHLFRGLKQQATSAAAVTPQDRLLTQLPHWFNRQKMLEIFSSRIQIYTLMAW